MDQNRSSKRRKRRKRLVRNIFTTLIIIALCIGGYFAYIFYELNSAANKSFKDLKGNVPKNHDKADIKNKPFTMLLLGIENQDGGQGRSDVILLITANPKSKEVAMLSIPRDSLVEIPSQGIKDKINHSYSYDGLDGTVETVYNLTGIPIDYYITTNFDGFKKTVDILGGVDVEVPFTFSAQLTETLTWKKYHQGPMHLDGREALAYVRMRKSDPNGDRGRNERQKQVIQEIVKKSSSITSITKIDDLIESLGENVQTNIPASEFLDFLYTYKIMKDTKIDNIILSGDDDRIDGIYYYRLHEDNLELATEHLKGIISHKKPEEAITFEEFKNPTPEPEQTTDGSTNTNTNNQ
ncbi:MAG: lytR [Bacillales bacterium]|jgi:LCP family protein required for cell wall assembly|nr:lytR [Bacillales bacterium]